MPVPGQLSREELLALLVVRDRQIAEMAGQLAELMEANEALAAKLAPVGASAVAELGQLLEPALA